MNGCFVFSVKNIEYCILRENTHQIYTFILIVSILVTAKTYKCFFLIHPHESGPGPLLRVNIAGIHRVQVQRQGDGVRGHQGLSCSQETHPNTAVCVPLLENPSYQCTGEAAARFRLNVGENRGQVKPVCETIQGKGKGILAPISCS